MLSQCRVLFLISLFSLCSLTLAGCRQRRLCCNGRNNTCKAVDDGLDDLPLTSHRYVNKQSSHDSWPATPYYEASGDGYQIIYPEVVDGERSEKIGRIVLPDVVELEGSGADVIYQQFNGEEVGPARLTAKSNQVEQLIFGQPMMSDQPEEHRRYSNQKPAKLLLRYSVLAKHLPLIVSHTAGEEDPELQLMYLEAPPNECFCDDDCVRLGDCCSDYTFVCPPRDCEVSGWGTWRSCVPDKGSCGLGVQQRERVVVRDRERGGMECQPLKEMRTCHKQCPTKTADLTTVALLIDYKFNQTRARTGRNNVYWDLPEVAAKRKNATYYCVRYEIGWVNRNCIDKRITKRLHRGNTICAECQPEAQLHRTNLRCASDLEDGDEGFWKLIGPKSCNGIWRRLERTENCHCSKDMPNVDPFLIV